MIDFAKQNIDIAMVYLNKENRKHPYYGQVRSAQDFIDQIMAETEQKTRGTGEVPSKVEKEAQKGAGAVQTPST